MVRFLGALILVSGCASMDEAGKGAAGKAEETAAPEPVALEIYTRRYDESGAPVTETVVDGGALYVEGPVDAGSGTTMLQVIVSLQVTGCEGDGRGEASLRNPGLGLDASYPIRLYCAEGASSMSAVLVGRVPSEQYDLVFEQAATFAVELEPGEGVPDGVEYEVYPASDGAVTRAE